MDVGPLRRHREYRLLFAGQALSFFGAMLTYVAIPYQVYHLTGSSLAVGLLSLAALVPLLVTAFIGGAFADAVDRRRMLQLAELALGLATAILFFNSLLDEPKVWVLFVVTPLMAAIDGFASSRFFACICAPARNGRLSTMTIGPTRAGLSAAISSANVPPRLCPTMIG